MTKKKNKFLTFCCSLLPGTGEMYLGFMKQGISLMGAFFLIWAITVFFNIPALLFVQPVIWFYSFFHVHNLNSMPDEEFYAMEDDYLFRRKDFPFLNKEWLEQNRKTVATLCILFGVGLLWNYLVELFYIGAYFLHLPNSLYEMLHALGTFSLRALVSICIIILGVHLIRNKKQELNGEDHHSSSFQDNNKS